MKTINKLKLENYKFFSGVEEFAFEGKNVLIYGENGSGKSSIYWALYTFFQSSLKEDSQIKKYFDTSHVENLTNRFIKDGEASSISLELIDEDKNIDAPLIISKDTFHTNSNSNTQIQEAMKASDFVNFKLLSRLYDFKNPQEIDLFVMFEKEVLNYLFIDDINLSSLWEELKVGLNPKPKMTDKLYIDFQSKIEQFNDYFEKLIPTILKDSNEFLKDDFDENLKISIDYKKASYNDFIKGSTTKRDSKTVAPVITLTVELLNENIEDKIIKKPHTFLNEAKLTAISLSIRFSILKNRLADGLKVLVLDDLLISLDMSYRIEVINMLDKHFSDFQLIIMTHDKGFYQLLKRKISTKDWKIYELYSKNEKQCVKEALSSFYKAKKLFEDNDYEATAHFLRKETEEILKHYLDPDLKYINKEFTNLETLIKKVKDEIELDYMKSFDKFFRYRNIDIETAKKIKNFENDSTIDGELKKQLYQVRGDLFNLFIKFTEYKDSEVKIFEELKNIKDRVLNPSAHYSEAPIFKKEIHDAIDLVERLKKFLSDKKTKLTPPEQNMICKNNSEQVVEEISENLNGFMINFTEEILDVIIEIDTIQEMNIFLEEVLLPNINSFSIEQFSKCISRLIDSNTNNKNKYMQSYGSNEYFNKDSGDILKKIFKVKEWDTKYKRIWCHFIDNVDMYRKTKEWFENHKMYSIADGCSKLFPQTQQSYQLPSVEVSENEY